MRYFFPFFAVCLLYAQWACAQESSYFQKMDGTVDDVVMGETIYVPVYSHIYARGKSKRLLETTLSIRNTDLKNEIIVTSVRYYNTEGVEVEAYLDTPHKLAPLATTEFIVEQNDPRGGSGANFIVEWRSQKTVVHPIVEAVMIGISGTQGLSFIRSGQVIATYP